MSTTHTRYLKLSGTTAPRLQLSTTPTNFCR